MHRAHRPVKISTLPHRRQGLTTPAVAIALLVIMMGLALIIDRIWLETARLELRTAAESSALAAAGELASDDLLRLNVPSDLRVNNARQLGSWIASQNYVCGTAVTLNTEPEGDIRLGRLIQAPQGILFEETEDNPTTVVVTGTRTRANNNPVALFIAGATKLPFGDVVARAEATVNNDLVGFRPLDGCPIPALPIAILESDPTQQRSDTWNNLIEARKGADNYSFDPQSHEVVSGGDGIPEIVVQSLRTGGKTTDPNTLLLDLGTNIADVGVQRQFTSGLTADDLKEFDGELWIGQGLSVEFSATPQFDGNQTTSFQDLIGERRICFLYSTTAPQRQPPMVTATCQTVVAVRIMAVNARSDGSCDVTLQPTVMTTRTALLASENQSPSTNPHSSDVPGPSDTFTNSLQDSLSGQPATTLTNATPNQYIYKLRLTQ